MRFFTKLSRTQLETVAALCGGVAVLLVAAAVLSGATLGKPQSLAAATALGDRQGVPPGLTGMSYPDYTYCQVLLDGKNPSTGPFCKSWGGSQDTFYVGALSVNLGGGNGQTIYQSRTYTLARTIDEGPASCGSYTLVQDSSGNVGCGYSSKSGNTIVTSPTCSSSSYYVVTSRGSKSSGPSAECYYDQPASLGGPNNASAGAAPSVSAGQTITLEWSCLPSRRVDWESCNYSQFDSSCHQTAGTYYSIGLASSVTGSGSGFSPSGLTGSQNVIVPYTSSGGSYTYGLTCNGGSGAMSITVNVASACPTAAWQPWSNGVFVIEPGATRHISGAQDFCVTNNSGSYILVPGGGSDPSGQLSTFRNHAANVGATTF